MQEASAAVDIHTYKQLVDRCARERLDQVIPNSSAEHARVLIIKLFETARQRAVIISGRLVDTTPDGCEVYGFKEVVDSARQFLKRHGTNLEIILEDPIDLGDKNRFLKTIVDDRERQGSVTIHPETGCVSSTRTPHMMASDALAYRMELDNEKVQAFANFGDSTAANLALEMFSDLETYVRSLKKKHFTFSPGQKFSLA
jgi:hypothetical protein